MELSEVRKNIDQVDSQIRKLFIQRMSLAEQVAQVKAQTEDDIYKPDREAAIIEKHLSGMNPKLTREYTALVKRIMEVSRKYQYGRTLELRDCFPYAYEHTKKEISHPAMLKEEIYLNRDHDQKAIYAADSYEEIGDRIKQGLSDAGIGVIEEIAVGASDALNDVLVKDHFYINQAFISERKGIRRKVVTFTDTLAVDSKDNRLKLMFDCKNHDGSLASILSMIADYGVNLTEIHSSPFKTEDSWNYRFYVELLANLDQKETRALVFQLASETERLYILGSYYCEGDI